jgi:hypothetical protein
MFSWIARQKWWFRQHWFFTNLVHIERRCIQMYPNISWCSLNHKQANCQLSGVGYQDGPPNATKNHLLLWDPHKTRAPSYSLLFLHSEMASSKTTSQAPRRRSSDLFTKPTRRYPPRITIARSLSQTNHNGELNTYTGIQGKNTKGAQILHFQIPPEQ